MPQENNMAELLRLMKTMIVKVDGLGVRVDDLSTDMKELTSDVQELKIGVSRLETRTDRLEGKVDLLSAQFRDVAGQAINDTERITSLEGPVDILENNAN